MTRTPDMVRLLDADPDLGGLLSDTRREQAERELVVRTHRLPVGPWDVSRLAGATADHVGLLIIDGILSRELVVADHVSAELLGPGVGVRLSSCIIDGQHACEFHVTRAGSAPIQIMSKKSNVTSVGVPE